MIVESLHLQGFMQYVNPCTITFKGRKVVGIVGPNEAGKSTLLQAITYAITGRTRAEREHQLVSQGFKGDMSVTVELRLDDGELFTVTRGRTKADTPLLEATGLRGKPSELAPQVEQRLGIGYDDFVAIAYFVQADIHQFMAGDKRAYFRRWTHGLERWERYEAAAAVYLKDVQAKASALRAEQEALRRQLAQQPELELEVENAEARLNEAVAAKLNAATKLKRWQRHSDRQRAARDLEQQARQAAMDMQRAVQQLTDHLNHLEVEEGRARRELKSVRGARCPLLNIHCEDLAASSGMERDKAQKRLATAKREVDVVQRKLTALEQRLVQASARDAAEQAANDAPNISDELKQAKRTHAVAERAQADATRAHAVAVERLEKARGAKAALEGAEARLERLGVQARRWQLVRYLCGKNGVPASIIERELEQVEDSCNWVLTRLGYAKRVRFSGSRELRSMESVCPVCGSEHWYAQRCCDCSTPRPRCRKEELTVTVLDGEVERPFALESGGAQVLQSFAVRLGAGLFRSRMTGVPMRMVMLDEVFAHLDAENRQRLITLVIDKLGAEFGLRQQLVVSHHEDVSNSVDNLLVVERYHGSSRATWA